MPLTYDSLLRPFLGPHPTPALIERRVRRWARLASALIFAASVAAVAVTRHIPENQTGMLLDLEFARSAQAVQQRVPDQIRNSISRGAT